MPDGRKRRPAETPELRRLRRRIDVLDRRIVALLNERAAIAREAGRAKYEAGRTAIRDAEREREVLLRVSMANEGPLPQADLLALVSAVVRGDPRTRVAGSGARRRPVLTLGSLPHGALTRFAPAPTGFLHLGHVANAAWVWGLGRAIGGRVLLRIEDHDRQRCRPEYDAALLEDLDWLGFRADHRAGAPVGRRTRRRPTRRRRLGCARMAWCTDATARGPRSRRVPGPGRDARAAVGPGVSPGPCSGSPWVMARSRGRTAWRGPQRATVAATGDLPIRDRHGNWTYGFCVVVDDLRQGVDLVIRGEDLFDATPSQIRLGPSPGSRGAADVPPPPAHPPARRPQALQVGR